MYQKTKAACEFKILDIQTSMNGTPEQQQKRTRKERVLQIKEQESERKMFRRKEEETQTLTTKLREMKS